MNWAEVRITADNKNVESIITKLICLGYDNYAVYDSRDVEDFLSTDKTWDYVDSDLRGLKETSLIVVHILKDGLNSQKNQLDLICSDLGELGSIEILDVEDSEWEKEWKKYLEPIKVTNRIVVKPIWKDYDASAEEVVIDIEPGMVFGTGNHESTQLALRSLEMVDLKDKSLLDIGTGTGILSIAAHKLGANNITAFDIDPLSFENSKTNFVNNNLTNYSIHNCRIEELCSFKFDVIVANIIAEVIIEVIDYLKPFMHRNSIFVTSGVINERADVLLEHARNNNLILLNRITKGEWNSLVFRGDFNQ